MSNDLTDGVPSNGVSPLRKKISTAILCGLVVVLLVEVRAALGHSLSGAAMQSASTDGNFHTTLFSDVDAMMILAPSKTVVRESPDEIEYRFSWYSLLRPLVQKVRKCPETEFFVVATRNADPAYALIYNTDAPTAESIETSRRALESFSSPPQENEESAGGHDAPGGGGGGGFAGQRQPPSDPAVALLDTNGDGELDEAEVAAASEVLFAADRNSDGKLTREEFPAGPTPPAGRRRPPMDDTEESDIPAAAVETEAAESKTKPGATESTTVKPTEPEATIEQTPDAAAIPPGTSQD